MWWKAFLAAFGLMFVAELGDKTQIVILTLSAKCGFRQVFLGAAAAFALLNLLAVSIGVVLYRFLPEEVIKYAVSAIFVLAGIIMLLSSREREEEEKEKVKVGLVDRRGPFLSAFLLVCLMELGDKTQLSLLALSAKYSQPVFIFIGGTLALWTTSLIGALVGEGLGRVIPRLWVHIVSGLIFIAFGIINLF
jgi:putative Ca2+/H+ antiporter (TMEM165/GDT1 family)